MELPKKDGSAFAEKGARPPEIVYTIMTPTDDTRKGTYPDSTFCVYNLLRRKFNHQYTYVFNSDTPYQLETATSEDRCADCMEYEHKMDNEQRKQKRIFCGEKNPDKLKGAGTISKVQIYFKSDKRNVFEGVTHYLAEYPVDVSLSAGQPIEVVYCVRLQYMHTVFLFYVQVILLAESPQKVYTATTI